MGLRALYNGVVRFTDVKVPRENILLAEGKRLKVAFSTLNTGRLTLPAACVGMSKKCLQYAKDLGGETRAMGRADREAFRHCGQDRAHGRQHVCDGIDDCSPRASSTAIRKRTFASKPRCVNFGARRWAGRLSMTRCRFAAGAVMKRPTRSRRGAKNRCRSSRHARLPHQHHLRRLQRTTMRLFLAREALDPHLKVAGPLSTLNCQWVRARKPR